ncbi:hypothetical protein Z043_104108 [Scleropages formosus]|uniref:Uncharacterized protein n=1 Tax=Scleropages formosus TaxID=113540 RepID=A0A0P7Z758_SCLFO|nr:hypothetical protein Z043_104108 [Scleropages formosus]
MMNHNKTLNIRKSVCFEKKRIFCAFQDLASIRSKEFVVPKSVKCTSVWDRKPPDFSPKLYTSLKSPERRKENIHSPSIRCSKDTLLRVTKLTTEMLPEICEKKTSLPPFTLRFRPTDSLASKILFVKSGKYPTMAYRDPKPYDFRQYAGDMPDMVTMLEKDPGNLKFKLQHLSPIDEKGSPEDVHLREHLLKFNTFKPSEPKWDARLILPKSPWPTKSAAYTRHRHRRGVYSALLDRVEEKLTNSWKNL